MWVVCCQKKQKHTGGATSHVEKQMKTQKRKHKTRKNKELPGFDLANFDWIV